MFLFWGGRGGGDGGGGGRQTSTGFSFSKKNNNNKTQGRITGLVTDRMTLGRRFRKSDGSERGEGRRGGRGEAVSADTAPPSGLCWESVYMDDSRAVQLTVRWRAQDGSGKPLK